MLKPERKIQKSGGEEYVIPKPPGVFSRALVTKKCFIANQCEVFYTNYEPYSNAHYGFRVVTILEL